VPLVEYEETPSGENTPQCGTLNARLQRRCQETEETGTAVSSAGTASYLFNLLKPSGYFMY
jgi:hypothetical protein